METIIKIRHLTKEFDNKAILKRILLEVKNGEVLGLLGSNGAGKTTLLKLLCGLLEPTEGEAEVFGYSPWNERDKVLNRLGVMIETPVFYEHLTAYENLEIHLAYMGKSVSIKELLNTVGLIGVDQKPVSKFSVGMKQRLGIARAISHTPDILLLDEPINGLDPVAIKDMRELFIRLKEKGTTIILSSHILSEILQTAESIVVISNGGLEHLGKIEDLQKQYGSKIEKYLIERMCG